MKKKYKDKCRSDSVVSMQACLDILLIYVHRLPIKTHYKTTYTYFPSAILTLQLVNVSIENLPIFQFALFAVLAVAFANPKPEPQVLAYTAPAVGYGYSAYAAAPVAYSAPYAAAAYPYGYSAYYVR